MPIVYQKEVNLSVSVAVWHITEKVDQLRGELYSADQSDIKEVFVEKKKQETIATRLTLKHLVTASGRDYQGIRKDEHGKPFLVNHADLHISISHAFPYAAAILDFEGPTGVDIESPREQIHRIKKKFLSEEELDRYSDIDSLTQAWCAKECLYKIFGRRQLIFTRHLEIRTNENGHIEGKVKFEDENSAYDLMVEKVAQQWLVYKSNKRL